MIAPRDFLRSSRLLRDQSNRQSGAAGDVDELIQAEKTDPALEKRIEARLGKTERLGRLRLRHVALRLALLDAHHELCAQLEVMRRGLVVSEV